MATLGPGIDGFIKVAQSHALGPGIDGFIQAIPSRSLGPGIDGPIVALPPPAPTPPPATTLANRLIGKALTRSYGKQIDGAARLSTTAGINAFTTGNHVIHTGVAGQPTVVRFIVVRCTAADSITAPLIAGVGVVGDDIYTDQELVGLTQVGKHWIFPVGGTTGSILVGEDLNLVISAAPTGVSQLIAVDVFGHEL